MATKKTTKAAKSVEPSVVEKAAKPRKVRSFDAARYQSSLGMLPSLFTDFNEEIKRDAQALRARARDASINDPFARRYFKTITQNVIGPHGIQLKMGIKQPNGTMDTMANYMLEQRWNQFSKAVTVDGKNLRESLKLILETTARDGEVFLVMRKGVSFGKYLVQVQLYEAEYVDINHNELAPNGNEIRQGIEYDYFGRAVAYHIWKQHPNTTSVRAQGYNERIRVDASEVIHVYSKERQSQGRGFPWLSASLLSLKHINEYTKSELIASRVASAKMGFFTKSAGSTENVGDYADEVDPNSFVQEAQPGMFDVLPEGWTVNTFDPQNPNSNYSSFIKTILEAVASSLGIAYHTLSGDLSSANYSSLRQGALDERETFKEIQQWLIETFLTPVFEQWLTNVLAFQIEGIRLPISKYDQFNAPIWRPRVWQWVDPAKDMAALTLQLEQNLRSRTEVCQTLGRDYVDVLNEIAAENELARSLGVVIEPTTETSNAVLLSALIDKPENTDDPPNPAIT
jgi:lambda family phage portal protein